MIMSILYGIIIEIRNKLYDYDLLTSQSFDKPIISIGNITSLLYLNFFDSKYVLLYLL